MGGGGLQGVLSGGRGVAGCPEWGGGRLQGVLSGGEGLQGLIEGGGEVHCSFLGPYYRI